MYASLTNWFGIPQIASQCEHVFLCSTLCLETFQDLIATDTIVAVAIIEVC